MGFFRIKDHLVDTRWEQGKVVAEQWFRDIQHLLHIGAVEAVPDAEVPADAVQPPRGVPEPVETVKEPEPEPAPEPAVEPEPEAVAEPEPAPEPVVEEPPAPPSRPKPRGSSGTTE